ncbi:MAG: hypothetical protein C4519_20740 [Desulfobacteraceae bacterium]|nr:MAG: hypothetical protein C4519_20740 [Desulfobacteraceae bacterium]
MPVQARHDDVGGTAVYRALPLSKSISVIPAQAGIQWQWHNFPVLAWMPGRARHDEIKGTFGYRITLLE